MPVRHPHLPSRFLLRRGFALTHQKIDRLREFGVRDLWIQYPGTEAIQRFIRPDVFKRRAQLGQTVCDMIADAQTDANARLPYDRYVTTIGGIVERLLADPNAALYVEDLNADEPSLMTHSMAVAYLSVLMGLKLDAYLIRQRHRLKPTIARDVANLGLGAMLHDIGMLKLNPDVILNYARTRNSDDPAYKKHVEIGYDMVKGRVDATAAGIVLNHHQRYDGTGFPDMPDADGAMRPLRGERIHIFARIVAVADTFEMLHHPTVGVTVPPVRAIGMMIRPPCVDWFDPQVLSAFLAVVPPYPPGTMLQLSDGRAAIAIDHLPDDPCRPIVQIIDHPAVVGDDEEMSNDADECEIIDLRQYAHLHVARADDIDVAQYNFLPPMLTREARHAS